MKIVEQFSQISSLTIASYGQETLHDASLALWNDLLLVIGWRNLIAELDKNCKAFENFSQLRPEVPCGRKNLNYVMLKLVSESGHSVRSVSSLYVPVTRVVSSENCVAKALIEAV